MTNEKSYIYFTIQHSQRKQFKIGETGSLEQRQNQLWSNERMEVSRFISFDGTKDERLFVEAYLRSKYAGNRNLKHCGLDHFTARTLNNAKGAENRFFVYVAEAFALLETIKNKKYNYRVYTGRYTRWQSWQERLEDLIKEE